MIVIVMIVIVQMTVVSVCAGVPVAVFMRCARTQRVPPRAELIRARPLEGVLRLEECCVDRERTGEVEGTEAQQLVDRHVGVLRAMDLCRAVDGAHLRLDTRERRFVDEIGLVEHEYIRERDLLGRLARARELPLEVTRIDQRDDGIEHELLAQLVVEKEGLRDRPRIGQPGGLDQHAIELVAAAHELPEDAQQVAAHGAADAAVVRLESSSSAPITSAWSTPTSPNSFSITAVRAGCAAPGG